MLCASSGAEALDGTDQIKAETMNALTLVPRIFAIVGAALLILALYQAHGTHRFTARAIELVAVRGGVLQCADAVMAGEAKTHPAAQAARSKGA